MATANETDLHRSYCKPYTDQENVEPFVFVSYAHVDKAKVKPIVDALHRQGFRVWYDEEGAGIPAGYEWEDWVFERLGSSAAFLGFVSQHNEHRPVVLKEIQAALDRRQSTDGSGKKPYPVFFVCLEKVSTRSFKRPDGQEDASSSFREHLSKCQFINYKKLGGLTERFMNVLINQDWPEGVIDNEWRMRANKPALHPSSSKRMALDECLVDENDFAELAHFERMPGTFIDDGGGKSYKLYRTTPDRIDRNTAYATYLDNQWVPESLFESEAFRTGGLFAESVVKERLERQRIEIFRGLLNNWQIVVNRASIWNSEVFLEWFQRESRYRDDFGKLVEAGALIVFLMRETGPTSHSDFSINEKAYCEWVEFCKKYKTTFLRFDWGLEDGAGEGNGNGDGAGADKGKGTGRDSNEFECAELVSRAFQDYCLTTASNRDRMKALAVALDIPRSEWDGFERCWSAVRADVVAWNEAQWHVADDKRKDYTRERFYREFLIKESRPDGSRALVKEGVLDWGGKPFVGELKRVVDFLYVMNLPLALKIHPLLPADSKLQPYLLTRRASGLFRREIEEDELIYAISEFDPSFAGDVYALDGSALSISDVRMLRELKSWRAYLCAVSESKDRSRLDQVDLFDALRVWERYRDFTGEARSRCDFDSSSWSKRKNVLTLLFRFEEFQIRVVYRDGEELSYSYWPQEWESLPSLNRKTDLSIGFICCDATNEDWLKDPFLAESRIFDGLTHKRGTEVVARVLDKLASMGHLS